MRVDVNSREILVDYDGTPEALAGLQTVVARLGYHAAVKSTGTETD